MRDARRILAAAAALLLVGAGIWLLRPSPTAGEVAVTFRGGAREVGGSCILVEVPGDSFLVDCGSFGSAGDAIIPERPGGISFVILTHAHSDHCGLLPELCAAGFDGEIYCTPPTADLVPVMLRMARNSSRQKVPRDDFDRSLASLRPVPYDETVRRGAVSFTLRRAQHLLGAAFVEVDVETGSGPMRIVFSGDLGSGGSLLLAPLEPCGRADYLVMESTYGGTVREQPEDVAERYESFAGAVGTALRRGGDVLIPAFTLGRTQEVLAALDLYADRGVIPPGTLIYSDSPTANRITRIYRDHPGELAGPAASIYGDEPLTRPTHREVRSRTTMKVHERPHEPAVFITSSGNLEYANAPRHLVRMADDPDDLLCIVGWQSPGSVGARLAAGDSTVLVRCREGSRTVEYWISPSIEVARFDAFSGHADADGLVDWAGRIEGVRRIFLVHGEPEQAQALSRRLAERCGVSAEVPSAGLRVVLETPVR